MSQLVPPQGAGRRPNWEKWRRMRWVKIWEGVALSLDIDPDNVRHQPMGLLRQGQEFAVRLAVARRNLGGLREQIQCSVSLARFAAECMSIGWPIPEELRALASQPAQAAPQAAKPQSEEPHAAAQRNVQPSFPEGKQHAQTPQEGQLADIQQAYDAIRADTRREPSQRAVAKKSGYSRETVHNCWPRLRRATRPE